jgi:hypothetical protein
MNAFMTRVTGRGTAVAKSLIKKFLLMGRFPSKTFEYAPQTGREIPVMMCLWNRPGRVVDMMRQLDRQDFARGVELYLWNNNRKDHRRYLELIASYTGTAALHRVCVVQSPFNLGSIARFYWARKLALAGRVGPVIVVDDDEDVTDDFVTICAEIYSPDVAYGFWAWMMGKTYWDRTPAVVGGAVDHVGPGGMVCDITLFRDPAFFREMPLQFWLLDDVWFSYFAKKKGLTLSKLPVDITFVLPETNQHHTQGPMKDEFFKYLYTR